MMKTSEPGDDQGKNYDYIIIILLLSKGYIMADHDLQNSPIIIVQLF